MSPVFVCLFLIALITTWGKPFFRQERTGKEGRSFQMTKFRTMNELKDRYGNLLPDDLRITRFGRILRKSSLDELPQLFNVFTGKMSLVGPRPLLPEYLKLYNQFQMKRHEVRPGITGWAQVNGRNALTWEEKFKFDVWYVENLSAWIDIKILIMTVIQVIIGKGISGEKTSTMEKFKGTKVE